MRVFRRQTSDGELALAVRVAGHDPQGSSGRPVVLVHGMGGDHRTWRSVAAVIRAAGRPVIAPDLRGHGRSGRSAAYRLNDFRDDLRFVLDELSVDSVDVVGHSLGAQSAVRLAMSEPDRVHRLVLEELPPMPRDQADLDEKITVGSSLGERLRGIGSAVTNPLPLIRFDRRLGADIGAEFETADPAWWQRLPAAAMPALIISGGARSFLPPRHLRTVAETMSDGRFTVIDAGHSVHRDRRPQFLRAVGDFLSIDIA